jgi:hypothetical protein
MLSPPRRQEDTADNNVPSPHCKDFYCHENSQAFLTCTSVAP